LLARACVDITLEAAQGLAEKASEENLDFIGIVYENIDLPENLEFNTVMDLSSKPESTILIRNIGAGVYSKDFLSRNDIELRECDKDVFPDIDVLWRTFIWAERGMFVEASVCQHVNRDTIWIDNIETAYQVNRRYDYIRDVLMQDFELWNKFKTFFSLQRWRFYFEVLHWMTEDVAWDFAERMVVEFHRSYELEEIDEMLFTAEERSTLYMLAKDPGFVKRFYLGKVILNKKIFDINNNMNRELETKQQQISQLQETLDKTIIQKDEERQRQVSQLEAAMEKALADKEDERQRQISQLEAERERALAEKEEEKQRQISLMNENFAREYEALEIKYKTSTTFRVGRIIMFVPTTIKDFLLKIKNASR
jgi:hypothetical protein